MNSILSRDFKYTNAASTNIAKTFARIRRELDAQKKREEASQAEAQRKVAKLKVKA